MRAGDSAQATLPAGEVTGAWDAVRQVSGSPSRFDRGYRRGLEVEPHYGRFYPRGIFHGLQGIVREALEPARITALDKQTMRVDQNHPLARFPFTVACRVDQVLPGSDMRGGLLQQSARRACTLPRSRCACPGGSGYPFW